jgi:putative peptidoglycan lipid II flippase
MDLTKNSFINSTFTLASQISGFVRDIFLAAFLGSGTISNIFVIALRLPFSFQQSLSGETFHSAFMPALSAIEGKEAAYKRYQLAKNILWISFLFLIPLILIAEIYMTFILQIIAPGMADSPKFDLLLLCSRISFPYLSFIVLSSVFAGLLNYRNKFSITASLPILLNLCVVSYVIFSKDLSEDKVIYLCWTLLVGGSLQLSLLLFATDREFWHSSINISEGFSDLKRFFKLIAPTFFSQTFIQINVLVGIVFASFFEGAVSYIYFADRVYMFPLTLIGISIATVLLPDLSRNIRINDNKSALKIQNKAYKLAIASSFPAALILIMLSHEIIQFIYERGEFSSKSTFNTSIVLQLFSLGLPAMCIAKILSPYYFAKEIPQTPFKITSFSVLINIVLTLILFQFIGYLSIPLSISITAFLTLIMYILDHRREGFFKFSPEIIKHTLKYVGLCLALSAEIVLIKKITSLYNLQSFSTLMISLILCFMSFLFFLRIFDKELIQDFKSLLNKGPN